VVVGVEVGVEVGASAGDMVWKYVGVAEELMRRTELRIIRFLFTRATWNTAKMIEL
jgi:hypothetical protein